MNEKKAPYELQELIAILEKIKLDGDGLLNFPKSIYTLALEMDNIQTSIQSITYEIDNIQKYLFELKVKNQG